MRKHKAILVSLLTAALVSGCSTIASIVETSPETSEKEQSSSEENLHPDTVEIGTTLTISRINKDLTLLDNNSALAADGLYYASWGIGNCVPYTNSAGEASDLYDGQLYILAGESRTKESAQKNMNNWLDSAKENYEIISETTIDCAGQEYTLITYNCTGKDNPYDTGVSAFTVCKNTAVCAELTCLEDYPGNPEETLTGFLENFSYHTEE